MANIVDIDTTTYIMRLNIGTTRTLKIQEELAWLNADTEFADFDDEQRKEIEASFEIVQEAFDIIIQQLDHIRDEALNISDDDDEECDDDD